MQSSFLVAAASAALVPAAAAQVASLHAWMTADNMFTASVSSSPTTIGDVFLTGNSWPTTFEGDFNFTQAGSFFVHVRAQDGASPEMFIARLLVTSGDATFGNGLSSVLTGDAAWTVSEGGPGMAPVAPAVIGPNGVGPWGSFPLMGSASFVWAPSSSDDVWFTIPVNVVPAPGAMAIAAIGLATLALRRRG